jgi:hypothetical protein
VAVQSMTDDRSIDLLNVLAISIFEARRLGSTEVAERLVEAGFSRLSADRLVAVQLGTAEPGRARLHTHARRA